ncbi:ATP-grasp domain-containing protein [Burkholderia sp. Cy-637]|nr:ATP-grasp domain-containing protein [Burkholderia sp. Cy-637]
MGAGADAVVFDRGQFSGGTCQLRLTGLRYRLGRRLRTDCHSDPESRRAARTNTIQGGGRLMHITFVDSNPVGLKALAAARAAGHRITFVASRQFAGLLDPDSMARCRELADRIVEIDTSRNDAELHDALVAIHRDQPLDAVVTALEYCAASVARCARRLGLAGTDPEAVALAQDKAAARARIEAAGMRPVRYRVADSFEQATVHARDLGYPMIAKPLSGGASIRAERIDDAASLSRYFASLDVMPDVPPGLADAISPQTLLEEYVEGPLFSVEVAAAGGEVLPLMISARKRCADEPSIELGTTMPAPVRPQTARQLTDFALQVARHLGLDFGIFHIELILGPSGPVLVEANPRIMGGNMPTVFALATGVDAYELLNEMYLTRRMPIRCRDVSAIRAATTRMIGAAEAATIEAEVDLAWQRPLARHVAAWRFDPAVGTHVRRMDSSYCPYHFQIVAESAEESSLLAEWIIGRTAHAANLKLRSSSEDYLFL